MGRGTIRKRGTGWGFVVDVPGAKPRQQIRRSGFPRRKDAEAALKELSVELGATSHTAHRLTFGQFAARWLEQTKPTVVESTWRRYDLCLRMDLLPALADRPLKHVTALDLNGVYQAATQRGLSSRSVRYLHATAHVMFKQAVRWGYVTANPAEAAQPPRLQPTRKPTVWTAGQLSAFLNTVTEHPMVWRVLATTGLRRSELTRLTWAHIDLDAGTLTVAGQTKTAASVRRLDLDPATTTQLASYRKVVVLDALRHGWRLADGTPVFVWEDGRPVTNDWISHRLPHLAERLGLPHMTPHGLRHTWATLAFVAGVPVKVVQERLGHSSPAVTQAIYQHLVPGMGGDAGNSIARIIDLG